MILLIDYTSPTHQIFLNVPMTFNLLFLLQQQFSNEKIWCSETKLWSKVNFLQHCLGRRYSETSVWFVHVTDIYLLFWWEKFESQILVTKSLFVQSCHPIWMGQLWTTLIAFIWQKCMWQWSSCFCIWKREAVWWFKFVILEPCG